MKELSWLIQKMLALQSSMSSLQVLGAEIEHRLPLDWPNQHGTVAALAQQLGSHVMEVKKVAVAGWAGMRFDDVILGVATF